MVLPVSGPFTKDIVFLGPPNSGGFAPTWRYIHRVWYRQKAPFTENLRYDNTALAVLAWRNSENGNQLLTASAYDAAPLPSGLVAESYNKCYRKFVGMLGDTAQWGANLAEYNSSVMMIVKRASQLRRFTKKLNSFDFPGATRELGMNRIPKGVKKSTKSLGDNWLEYHFGWEPLVKDIGNSVDILQKEPLRKKVLSKSNVSRRSYDHPGGSSPVWVDDEMKVFHRISADISVSNPNLFLANQMGFVNPLSIAWEVVPYSFVVDWFANVGEVLSSMTDFVGLSVKNATWTYLCNIARIRQSPFLKDDLGEPAPWSSHLTSSYMKRDTGAALPGPSLLIKPFNGFSPARGATAISLLLKEMR